MTSFRYLLRHYWMKDQWLKSEVMWREVLLENAVKLLLVVKYQTQLLWIMSISLLGEITKRSINDDVIPSISRSSIQGSIICPNTSIGEKCELKDCFVASGRSIKANCESFLYPICLYAIFVYSQIVSWVNFGWGTWINRPFLFINKKLIFFCMNSCVVFEIFFLILSLSFVGCTLNDFRKLFIKIRHFQFRH